MITATQITYLHLCHRKLWLVRRGIRMENQNAAVREGKWISETTYRRRPRRWRELALPGIKIDHYDPKQRLVREVKKSPKLEHAHVAQVKYYLYRMEEAGIADATGVIEYPKQRRSTPVELTDADRSSIMGWLVEIERIAALPDCPELVRKPYCRNCAFRELCFI